MSRASMIAAITGGLIVAGAVFGALAGMLAFALAGGMPWESRLLWVYRIPAALGAVVGAIVFPIGAWIMLRTVPLGRAILGAFVGAVVGGAAGYALPLWPRMLFERSVLGACVGFLVAAALLRRAAKAGYSSATS